MRRARTNHEVSLQDPTELVRDETWEASGKASSRVYVIMATFRCYAVVTSRPSMCLYHEGTRALRVTVPLRRPPLCLATVGTASHRGCVLRQRGIGKWLDLHASEGPAFQYFVTTCIARCAYRRCGGQSLLHILYQPYPSVQVAVWRTCRWASVRVPPIDVGE